MILIITCNEISVCSIAFQTTALGDKLIKLRESLKCTFVVPDFDGIVKKSKKGVPVMPDRRVICLVLVLPAETLIGKVKSWWFHNFFDEQQLLLLPKPL